jgi:hypothetical protein
MPKEDTVTIPRAQYEALVRLAEHTRADLAEGRRTRHVEEALAAWDTACDRAIRAGGGLRCRCGAVAFQATVPGAQTSVGGHTLRSCLTARAGA